MYSQKWLDTGKQWFCCVNWSSNYAIIPNTISFVGFYWNLQPLVGGRKLGAENCGKKKTATHETSIIPIGLPRHWHSINTTLTSQPCSPLYWPSHLLPYLNTSLILDDLCLRCTAFRLFNVVMCCPNAATFSLHVHSHYVIAITKKSNTYLIQTGWGWVWSLLLFTI